MIAAQKICPVSGEALGQMGAPVKTKIGDQTLFLCCKACVGKEPSKENLQKVTDNLIAAQGTCTVLGNPLPKDAPRSSSTIAKFSSAAKMCIAKIKADPNKYIAKLDEQIEKNLNDHPVKKS